MTLNYLKNRFFMHKNVKILQSFTQVVIMDVITLCY